MPRNHLRSNLSRCGRRGATMVFFTVTATVLFGFVGLVLDGGRGYFERRRAQAAADAGAYAGALELSNNNAGWVTASAQTDTALNGFDDQDSDVTVTVNHPPASGPNAGNADFVEVIVDKDLPTTFMRVLGHEMMAVRARAVVGMGPDWGDGCILALNESASGAITISGTANLNTPNCEVVTNSTAPDAIVANGGGCIDALLIAYGSRQGLSGGYTANGQNCLNPAPVGSIPTPDPYAGLAEPVPGNFTNQLGNGNDGLTITGNEPQPVVLQSGYYPGGIRLNGGEVHLNPGVYVVDGLTVNGTVTLVGHGVTIFNTGAGNGDIQITGGANLDLTAPTAEDDPYQNMLFWNSADISCNNPNQCDAIINGTSGSTVDGVLYFPSVQLTYAGVENTNNFTQIIADTIKITGTAYVATTWGSDAGARTPSANRPLYSE